MQTIELTHPYKKEWVLQEPIVLALGFFDGIHLGHREVITTAKRVGQERGFKVAVMSLISIHLLFFKTWILRAFNMSPH